MSFEALKARQSEAWDSAPWEPMAARLAAIHDHLVARLAPGRGERWLDIGTGTGAVALRAARAGAHVTGVDLSPVMVDTARRLAGGHPRPPPGRLRLESVAEPMDRPENEDVMSSHGQLDTLATAVRAAVARRTGWRESARLVASELERHLPSPRILTAEQRAGDPETFRSHVLHSEPDASRPAPA